MTFDYNNQLLQEEEALFHPSISHQTKQKSRELRRELPK
jgi:hypothetical protein